MDMNKLFVPFVSTGDYWDMNHGTDDGPWNDGIPFDGRDVWHQLTPKADDEKQNYWRFKPGSLINLGREMPFHAAGHGRVAMNCHTCAIDSITFLPMLLLFLLTGISIILTPTKGLLLHPWKLYFKVGPWELLGSVDNTISQQMKGFKQG
jgi:hypothetical protein